MKKQMYSGPSVARILVLLLGGLFAASTLHGQASSIPSSQLINVEDLSRTLQSGKGEKPIILQVGSHVLYQQAHIPGSDYAGAGSTEAGLTQLKERVEFVPKKKFIVLYCGCCPWSHCPNVKPAFDTLHALGFTNVKVLYIANNFGTDWVNKGYPVASGH
ncbi:MAG TPA: rhodanese-like domain-containing protein [Verrucomicrobiae bacterium]|jgi:thiosulfate/3-mercaptopyruvate sulfurtransferase|nr:rhodanese-like domain-containing protein [Verrucomicrobiae bacterium]